LIGGKQREGFHLPDSIEWVEVTGLGNRPIGAIGFVQDKAAIIASYHEGADANRDGKVSIGERLASFLPLTGGDDRAIAEVAMSARYDPDILQRDADFAQYAVRLWLNFGQTLIAEGIYTVYFARGVSFAAGGVAKRLSGNAIARFTIRKGLEKTVETAVREALAP
jgi:hypothetical protein